MSSRFLYHESCPSCGSRDNLGIWDDGHKFCFGCKYYEAGEVSIHHVFNSSEVVKQHIADYPYDASENIPFEPLSWLLKCGITFQLQKKFGIEWSNYRQMLVWKVLSSSGKFLGWQGRCFSKDARTKYFISGNIHDDICILGEGDFDNVILCEDYISAIRISRIAFAIPLFGCTISIQNLLKVKEFMDETIKTRKKS